MSVSPSGMHCTPSCGHSALTLFGSSNTPTYLMFKSFTLEFSDGKIGDAGVEVRYCLNHPAHSLSRTIHFLQGKDTFKRGQHFHVEGTKGSLFSPGW
jgi:hypothetical protein